MDILSATGRRVNTAVELYRGTFVLLLRPSGRPLGLAGHSWRHAAAVGPLPLVPLALTPCDAWPYTPNTSTVSPLTRVLMGGNGGSGR
jgi:hypothetical protein